MAQNSKKNFIDSKIENDDLFLCRAFAKAISSDPYYSFLNKQSIEISTIENSSTNENISMEQSPKDILQWNLGDLCLCPYSEDGILYKATIIDLNPPNCTVLFDDYGNEETHLIIELKIRNENERFSSIEQNEISIQENDPLTLSNLNRNENPSIIPSMIPPVNLNENSNDLQQTLMSWYLAGYHTGFYQAIRQKRN